MSLHPGLLTSAQKSMSKSYSPYSKFKVGAAILSKDKIFSGCNVENSSYRLTICAEASAICQMVNSGYSQIEQIIIIAPDKHCSPCGACRQMISEFSTLETKVFYYINGDLTEKKITEILPDSFKL